MFYNSLKYCLHLCAETSKNDYTKTQRNVTVYLLCHTGLMTLNLVFKHDDPLPLAGADFFGQCGLDVLKIKQLQATYPT